MEHCWALSKIWNNVSSGEMKQVEWVYRNYNILIFMVLAGESIFFPRKFLFKKLLVSSTLKSFWIITNKTLDCQSLSLFPKMPVLKIIPLYLHSKYLNFFTSKMNMLDAIIYSFWNNLCLETPLTIDSRGYLCNIRCHFRGKKSYF